MLLQVQILLPRPANKIKEVVKIKIRSNDFITNHRRFKVIFSNGGEREYELNRENKGIFFYDVYNGKEKLGFTRVTLYQQFIEKFPGARFYSI